MCTECYIVAIEITVDQQWEAANGCIEVITDLLKISESCVPEGRGTLVDDGLATVADSVDSEERLDPRDESVVCFQ